MKEIKSLFVRDFSIKECPARPVLNGDYSWVLEGKGKAYRKMDGMACMVMDGKLYKRYDCKRGRTAPAGFIPCQEPDEDTGHWPGWVAVGDGPEDAIMVKFFRRKFSLTNVFGNVILKSPLDNGTYEFVGPKVNGNREGLSDHFFLKHDGNFLSISKDMLDLSVVVEKSYLQIYCFLRKHRIEGIVWHRGNGEMVKIKRSDFGLEW